MSRPSDVSEQEWALLSDEEREAFGVSMDDLAGDDGTDGLDLPDDDDAAGDGVVDTPAAASEPAAEPKPAADPVADPEPEPEPFIPKLTGDVPAELQAKLDDLDKQFEEGDIGLREYNAQRDALRDQILDARIQAQREQHTQQQQDDVNQKASAKWNEDVRSWIDADENKDLKSNGWLFSQVDAEVKRLASDKAVVDRVLSGELDNIGVLNLAKKNVTDGIRVLTGGKAEPGKRPAAGIPDVKTLGDAPPAANNGTGESPYAHLDNLTGEAFEAALARLSPEQQDAYLSGR